MALQTSCDARVKILRSLKAVWYESRGVNDGINLGTKYKTSCAEGISV